MLWAQRVERTLLLLLTLAALLVHGYHPFAEDAEIYLPGVEKMLDPRLFPAGAEFFESHAHLTFFPNLIAFSQRCSHLRLEVLLLLWQLASIFLFLLACWQLLGKCFAQASSRWAGVVLMAGLLTLPVAGTALYIVDQYVNPRNLAAFAAVFGVVRVLEKKYLRAGAWIFFGAAVHPLMAVFALFYCVLLAGVQRWDGKLAILSSFVPAGIAMSAPPAAYHRAALAHSFHYILRWHWYEWLGVVGPLALLIWLRRIARSRGLGNLREMCSALLIYGALCTVAAVALALPQSFESLARLQPMRSFHLLYILLFLFLGGLLGEYVLKNRVWRLALFVPLGVGMGLTQRALFPQSAHIEWPGAPPRNPWVQAFLWIRSNTPVDAFFAIDPNYMQIPGEDIQGFRAIAQRSHLADAGKDSGVVSMFPSLAEEWLQQMEAQENWKDFTAADFRRLKERFAVTWMVAQSPGIAGMNCPYRNATVVVCRLAPE